MGEVQRITGKRSKHENNNIIFCHAEICQAAFSVAMYLSQRIKYRGCFSHFYMYISTFWVDFQSLATTIKM